MKKRIFTYWQNAPGKSMPPYVALCMETWKKAIPDVEIVVIDHENLFQWVEPYFDMPTFLRLSLPQQSDVVSYSVLFQHGGVFLDADTIITKDFFMEVEGFAQDKVHFFGVPDSQTLHMAFMAAPTPHHPALMACIELAYAELCHMQKTPGISPTWSLFGNYIISQMLKTHHRHVVIHDRTAHGVILETSVSEFQHAEEKYLYYYFVENGLDLEREWERIAFGIVCLHNSWTPDDYKTCTAEEILSGNPCPLFRMLQRALL